MNLNCDETFRNTLENHKEMKNGTQIRLKTGQKKSEKFLTF